MDDETKIKAEITQVEEAKRYRGNVTFNDFNFQYEITFGIPVTELEEAVQRNPDSIMEKMYLKVRDSAGRNVPLDEQIKGVFMGIIGPLALELHYAPQNDRHDLSEINMFLSMSGIEGKASSGMEREYTWPKISALEDFLESHKE